MTYEVGETVEYKPPGGPVGVFTIIRRMPHDPSGERIYRIKSDLEFCERNVLELRLPNWRYPRRHCQRCGISADQRLGSFRESFSMCGLLRGSVDIRN